MRRALIGVYAGRFHDMRAAKGFNLRSVCDGLHTQGRKACDQPKCPSTDNARAHSAQTVNNHRLLPDTEASNSRSQTSRPLPQLHPSGRWFDNHTAHPELDLLQIGNVAFLTRRCEELQGDVVWVAERQAGAVVGADDPAVLDPEFVQPRLPAFELGSVCAPERDVV